MSVTFLIAGEREYCAGICDDFTCGVCSTAHERAMNLANVNAYDLLAWLGVTSIGDSDCYGELDASDLAARCRRRLWPEARNVDAGRAEEQLSERAVICGRPAGRLQEYAERLLRIAERAYSSGRNVSYA